MKQDQERGWSRRRMELEQEQCLSRRKMEKDIRTELYNEKQKQTWTRIGNGMEKCWNGVIIKKK